MSDTQSARDDILSAIRRQRLVPVALADHDGPWIRYADVVSQFIDAVRLVGGEVQSYRDIEELGERLVDWKPYCDARVRCSAVEGIANEAFRDQALVDGHALCDVDIAIVPGEIGVAENGAIWVEDQRLPHRVLPFLAQHLVLVLPRAQVCHNMHEAYASISMGARPFGVFISGPSKTADIEQSLVIGAHGARSLLVAIVDIAPCS